MAKRVLIGLALSLALAVPASAATSETSTPELAYVAAWKAQYLSFRTAFLRTVTPCSKRAVKLCRRRTIVAKARAVSFSKALSAAQVPDDLVHADTILKQGLTKQIVDFKRLIAHPKLAGRCSCAGGANLITNAIGEVNDVAGTSLPILA
jgi:hypothetical protein